MFISVKDVLALAPVWGGVGFVAGAFTPAVGRKIKAALEAVAKKIAAKAEAEEQALIAKIAAEVKKV
jgi:hypothetical protein